MNTITTLEGYIRALNQGQHHSVSGLCGRVIRGKRPEDFLTLSDDTERKLIMLVGSDGLEMLLNCKSGQDMLVAIGYEPTYIQRKVAEGNQFKLVVFPESTSPAALATWEGVVNSVHLVYPQDIWERVLFRLPELRELKTPATPNWTLAAFEEFEQLAGVDFSQVDAEGKTNPYYMTEQRYRESSASLIDTRAFLYFSLHLRELFAGDGYTYDVNGIRGMCEYFCPNIELAKLGEHAVVDLHI